MSDHHRRCVIGHSLVTTRRGHSARPPGRRVVTPPAATSELIWLDGRRWEVASPENADVFVVELAGRRIVLQARSISR